MKNGSENGLAEPRSYTIFALFAVAILFSMIREWAQPIACLRPMLERVSTTQTHIALPDSPSLNTSRLRVGSILLR